MKPLLIALLAIEANAATLYTYVAARSGPEVCAAENGALLVTPSLGTGVCAVSVGIGGDVAAFAHAEEDFLWIGGYRGRGDVSAYAFASAENEYLPTANGHVTFAFSVSGFVDGIEYRNGGTFNGEQFGPLACCGFEFFTVPVFAGVPFAYTVTLEAGEVFDLAPGTQIPYDPEQAIGRPFGYEFFIERQSITFIPTPEPGGALLLLAGLALALIRRRSRA